MATLSVGVTTAILVVLLVLFVAVVMLRGYLTKQTALRPGAELISAWRSQPWWSLACSFFAAAFGASALAANPEAGAFGGWVSVICYGLANGSPYFILMWAGPRIQEFLRMDGFTIIDFVHKRYGKVMALATGLLSVFFMFIWLSAELTSVGYSIQALSPNFAPAAAMAAIAGGVAAYALFAGFRGSIFTDKVQGPGGFVCLVIVVIGILTSGVSTSARSWREVSTVRGEDFSGGAVLILSTTLNQFLDLGSWQRVFASNSRRDAQLGLFAAGSVNFLVQSTVTFLGLFAAVTVAEGSLDMDLDADAANSFFILVKQCHTFYAVIALILVIALATSTVDSLENSITSAFVYPFMRRNISVNWARVCAVCLIVPSVILAMTDQSVLSLFLLSNIFSAAIIPPIFLGLSPTLATKYGAWAGLAAGLLTIFVCGWAWERDFVKGLRWPMFERGFNDLSTCMTFIIVPAVSCVVTLAVSRTHLAVAPQTRAEQERLLQHIQQLPAPSGTAVPHYSKSALAGSILAVTESPRGAEDVVEVHVTESGRTSAARDDGVGPYLAVNQYYEHSNRSSLYAV